MARNVYNFSLDPATVDLVTDYVAELLNCPAAVRLAGLYEDTPNLPSPSPAPVVVDEEWLTKDNWDYIESKSGYERVPRESSNPAIRANSLNQLKSMREPRTANHIISLVLQTDRALGAELIVYVRQAAKLNRKMLSKYNTYLVNQQFKFKTRPDWVRNVNVSRVLELLVNLGAPALDAIIAKGVESVAAETKTTASQPAILSIANNHSHGESRNVREASLQPSHSKTRRRATAASVDGAGVSVL